MLVRYYRNKSFGGEYGLDKVFFAEAKTGYRIGVYLDDRYPSAGYWSDSQSKLALLLKILRSLDVSSKSPPELLCISFCCHAEGPWKPLVQLFLVATSHHCRQGRC